jgi:hypothetical protein
MLPVAALVAGCGAVWSGARWWRVTLAVFLSVGLAFCFAVIAGGTLGDNRYLADLDLLRADPRVIQPWHSYLNAHATDGGVLLVGDAQPFDLDMPAHYNTVFDASIFESIVRDHTPAEAHAQLLAEHIAYVLVAWSEIERYRSPGNYGFTEFVRPEVLDQLLAAGVLAEVPRKGDERDQLFRVLPESGKSTRR